MGDYNGSTQVICESLSLSKIQIEQYKFWQYWLEGVIQVVLSSIGLLANIFSIFILTRKRLVTKIFNKLLTAMVTFDCIFLALMFYECLGTFVKKKDTWSYVQGFLTPHLLYPVKAISMTASIYIMMAVAVERYIAVCTPFNRIPPSLQQCETDHHRKRTRSRLRYYIVPVILFSIIFNLNKFFESSFCHNCAESQYVHITDLRTIPIYLEINACARLLFLGVVPVVVTSILNYKIYVVIRRSVSDWPQNSILLFLIVFIFIFCSLPRIIILMYEVTVLDKISLCKNHYWYPFWNHILGSVSHELLVLNPLLNFFAYCVAGRTFRQVTAEYTSRLIPCMTNYTPPPLRCTSSRMTRMTVVKHQDSRPLNHYHRQSEAKAYIYQTIPQKEEVLLGNNGTEDDVENITTADNV